MFIFIHIRLILQPLSIINHERRRHQLSHAAQISLSPQNVLCVGRSRRVFATEIITVKASTTRLHDFISFCEIFFTHAVFFCFGLIKAQTQTSLASPRASTHLVEPSKSWISILSTQIASCSSFQACHGRRFQSLLLMMAPFHKKGIACSTLLVWFSLMFRGTW